MIRYITQSLLSFVYPPFCLHCDERMDSPSAVLCPSCLSHVQLLEIQGRCRYCFSLCEGRAVCFACAGKKVWYKKGAAAVDAIGPAGTLLRNFMTGKRPHMAPALGGLMTMQYLVLNWPFPDLIVPVPSAFGKRWEVGFDPVELLAREMGKTLQKPVTCGLRRNLKIQDFSSAFRLKKGCSAADQRILVLTDALTKDNELVRLAAACLQEAFPREVFVMAFAKTNS